eukprot:5685434-Amphidinium_carterae.1
MPRNSIRLEELKRLAHALPINVTYPVTLLLTKWSRTALVPSQRIMKQTHYYSSTPQNMNQNQKESNNSQ